MNIEKTTPQTLDRSSGRLQLVDGTLFYSPNNSDILEDYDIPIADTPNGEDCRKIFQPHWSDWPKDTLSRRLGLACSSRWWTSAWGWTAFIPDCDWSPLKELLSSIVSSAPFTDRQHVTTKEKDVVDHLEQAIDVLRHEFSVAVEAQLPEKRPTAYMPDQSTVKLHPHEWLLIWIGLLSSVISETEDEERWDSEILQWQHALRQNMFTSDWINKLMGSVICDQSPSCQRAGTFIDLNRHDKHKLKSLVFRLCNWSVPVWYPWLPEYTNDPLLACLSPLPSQLQDMLDSWTHPTRSLFTLIDEVMSRRQSTPAYQTFFTERATVQSCLRTDEALFHFRRPKDATHFPPDPCAKVFEWIIDDNNCWTRCSLPPSWRHDTLANYGMHQKRYDDIANEWDCWIDATSQRAGFSPLTPCLICPEGSSSSAWHSDRHTSSRCTSQPRSYDPSRFTEQIPYSRLPTIDLDPLSFLPQKESKKFLPLAERYILYIMQRFYGFSHSKKYFPMTSPDIDQGDISRLLHLLGIPLHAVPDTLFERPAMVAAVQFVSKIYTNTLHASEFTLSGDHIANAVFKSRLSCLTVIPPSSTHGTLYMFDFTSKNKTSRPNALWYLTVLTAAHALLVCRLPARFFEREMAIYLTLQGIPFKTLQKASSLLPVPSGCTPSRLIPHRPNDYKFVAGDYTDYMNGTQELLSSPRCARAALMRGGFPWRIAMMYVSLYCVLDGPTGFSSSLEDHFVVKIPGTFEVYVDDALTEIEAALLCGLFHTVKDSGSIRKKLYYPPDDILVGAGINCDRWVTTTEKFFTKWAEGTKTGLDSVDGISAPSTYAEWKAATRPSGLPLPPNVAAVINARASYEESCRVFIDDFVKGRMGKKKDR
ncbi:hypothetical protein CVT24_003427 [Panaeolus cyanescens]|uniref:Uncharacterized protein n=1 Tax=Panaeolus cyanescens TaxID=181874 RepID=A0A409Y6W8_9AGAR|nr:hypothetical protein CVT24_003427 [Panaeolus cyanescens]